MRPLQAVPPTLILLNSSILSSTSYLALLAVVLTQFLHHVKFPAYFIGEFINHLTRSVSVLCCNRDKKNT